MTKNVHFANEKEIMNFENGSLKSKKSEKKTKLSLSNSDTQNVQDEYHSNKNDDNSNIEKMEKLEKLVLSTSALNKCTSAGANAASGTNSDSHIDSEELSLNHPLIIAYNMTLTIIEKLNPYNILQETADELSGYQSCIQKGMNTDKLPPTELGEGEAFYKWCHWKKCSLELNKNAWTPNKFKEEAMKRYITIAEKYCFNYIMKS